MHILDDLNKIKKLDQSGMRNSIAELHKQAEQVYNDFQRVRVSKEYRKINKIVINGMGGSGLGGHILKSLYKDELRIPLEVVNSYKFPNYLDDKTLYLIFSYSGNTEEPLSAINLAIKRKARIFCVSVDRGSRLAKIARRKGLAHYTFTERHNPSRQPRMGLGYSIFTQLLLLKKLGIVKVSNTEIENVILLLKKTAERYCPEKPYRINPVKKLADQLRGKAVIVVAAEHLRGNAHALANQINENAKQLAFPFKLPEINHHLLEGLKHPKSNSRSVAFALIDSGLYYERNQKRLKVTQEVVKGNKVACYQIKIRSKTALEQVYETLVVGSYLSFYLAMLNNIDPAPIPWVDYFKKKLA